MQSMPPMQPAYAPPPAQRPPAVSVLAILNIVFGVLALLCLPFALISQSFQNLTPSNPVMEAMKNPTWHAWTMLSAVLGIFAAIAEIAGGIGMLGLKPWGRRVSVGFGIYSLAVGVINLLLFVVILVGPILAILRQTQDPAVSGGAVGGLAGGVMGGVMGMLYPGILLFFLTRPEIKAAFDSPPSPPYASGPPPQYPSGPPPQYPSGPPGIGR
jgi:hypothetical protein